MRNGAKGRMNELRLGWHDCMHMHMRTLAFFVRACTQPEKKGRVAVGNAHHPAVKASHSAVREPQEGQINRTGHKDVELIRIFGC